MTIALRFCVEASDASGNFSVPSCSRFVASRRV
jgi:hypothetical protein